MDKYEFNVKVEQIKKLVMKEDFETAMKIADTIDWHRVRNANLLAMISQVYENNGEYLEAKEILLQAYERAPVGKRLLFKLAELALREGNVREAEDYYREFCEVAPGDSRQSLLRYLILKERGTSVDKLLPILESYVSAEMDEQWMYELAELYSQAGEREKCVQMCDRMILMFGLGKYVEKAMKLKVQYAPLNDYQQDLVENKDKYEAKLKAVEEEFSRGPLDMLMDDDPDEDHFPEDRYPGDDYPENDYPENGYSADDYPEDSYSEDNYPGEESSGGEAEEYAMYDRYQGDEELVANLHQAAVEENLAQEVSRIAQEGSDNSRIVDEPTKTLYDIRRSGMAGTGSEEKEARIEDDEEQQVIAEAAVTKAEQPEGAESAQENEASFQAGDSEEISAARQNGAGRDPGKGEAPAQEPVSNHLSVEARTPEKGLKVAIDALKKYHVVHNTHNQTLKITGSKLNSRGIMNVADRLRGKDLIIEEAGDLSEDELKNLEELMTDDTSGMVVVLIDNPRQMEEMYQKNPEFMQMFEHIDGELVREDPIEQAVMRQVEEEERQAHREEEQVVSDGEEGPEEAAVMENDDYDEEMDADAFAEYACQYASQIDCSILGKSMLALYERVELMEEDGIPLTRATAEELIEEAADKAEKPSLGRLITGVFSPKYDKEGLLILREEHFI